MRSFVLVVLMVAACEPTSPTTWTLNWVRNGDVEAYSPFISVEGDIQTEVTVRMIDVPGAGRELSHNRFVYDLAAEESLENSFRAWPAHLRGSQERLDVTIDSVEDQPLDHTEGRCVRAEWPEYDEEPDMVAVYWCTGVWAEESIWLAQGSEEGA